MDDDDKRPPFLTPRKRPTVDHQCNTRRLLLFNDSRVQDRGNLHIRVPQRLLDELKRRSRDESESQSTIVRRALRHELQSNIESR